MRAMFRRLGAAISIVVAAGCVGEEPTGTTEESADGSVRPALLIATKSGFQFLPPMVRTAGSATGSFDPSRAMTVRIICVRATGRACPEVARLSTTTGGLTVNLRDEYYGGRWRVPTSLETGSDRYLLQVLDEDVTIAEASLWVVGSRRLLQGVRPSHVGVVRGSVLEIRFRVETGTVGSSRLEVSPAAATLLPGEVLQLTGTLRSGGASAPGPITWSSSAPDVAEVSPDGLVSAVGAGTAQVTAAAGGLSASAQVTVVPLPEPVTRTFSSAGGSVDVPLGGGRQFSMVVPAGALSTPVEFRFTPRAPRPGSLATVGVTPSDVLFRTPVLLTVTLGTAPSAATQAQVVLALALPSGPAALLLPTSPSGTGGLTFMAATAILGQPAPLPTAGPAASVAGTPMRSELEPDQGEIDVVVADAQRRADALRAAADRLEAELNFDAAIEYRLAAAAVLQLAGDPEGISGQVLAEVEASACSGIGTQFNLAEARLGTEFRNLRTALRPILAYAGSMQALGVDPTECEELTRLTPVLDGLVAQFVELYTAAMQRAVYPANAPALHDELWQALSIRRYGALLGIPARFAEVKAQLQLPIAGLWRQAAYSFCRTDEDHQYLGTALQIVRDQEMYPQLLARVDRLRETVIAEDLPFTAEAISSDIQYCGTSVTVASKASDGTGDPVGPIGGGDDPGVVDDEVTVRGKSEGTIELDGKLVALACPEGGYGNDVIAVTFNGQPFTEYQRIDPTGQFIRVVPKVLSVTELLAAGNVPANGGGSFPLAVTRKGNGCGGAYLLPGETEERPLLRIAVEVPKVTVTPATLSLNAGEQATFTATVEYSESGVTWEVEGGTGAENDNLLTFTAGDTPGTYTITARSVDDPDRSGSATVTIGASCPAPGVRMGAGMALSNHSCVALSVSPSSTTVGRGGTHQFTALVSGTSNPAVTWTASRGTITGTGLFTAPTTDGAVTITASSVEDPTVQATAEVTVRAFGGIIINPAGYAMGFEQSRTFSIVGGTGPFTWSTDANAGTVNTAGTFTAGTQEGEFGVYVSSPTGAARARVIVDKWAGIYDGTVRRNTTESVRTWSIGRYTNFPQAGQCTNSTLPCYFTGAIDFGSGGELHACYFQPLSQGSQEVQGSCEYSTSAFPLGLTGTITATGALTLTARNGDGSLTLLFTMGKR